MNKEDLSPEAQQRLKEITPSTDSVENWNFAFMNMLKKLAERNTSDVTEWEIKGQGIEVLEKSREEHSVAVELKAYAIPLLETFRLLELDGSPELPPISLDEFLKKTMPNTGKDVLRERFMRFLIEKAESEVDRQMELHPRPDISRDERVKQMATNVFSLFDEDGVAGPTRNFYGPWFREWWKRHEGNSLSGANEKKGAKKSDRHEALIALLPSRPDKPGITKDQWRDKAKKKGLFGSLRTLNRDVQLLSVGKKIQVQENGNFRQLPK